MSLVSPFSKEHEADPFGDWPQWRKNMGLGPHRGKDFNDIAEGTPIPASGAGVAVGSGWSNALGWWVVIRYEADGRYVYFGYCHLRDRTHLSYGDEVARGESVGLLGNSGSASTGAHLHLTASWQNGDPGWTPVIDPMQFFTSSSTAGEFITPIIGDIMATGLIVHTVDGPNKGDVFYLDRKTAVHIGNDTDLDRAERLIGRGKAANQKQAEIDTFCALFGIPAGTLRKGVKYFG